MRRILLLLLGAALLTLCGCGLSGDIDELYSLPQMADEYMELQRAIDDVLSGGAVYSAPVDGVHRQSVQLCDLNGDGEEEAVVRHPAVEVDAGDDGDGAKDKQERGMAKPAPMRRAAGEEQPGPGQRRDPADEVGQRMERSHTDHDQDVGQREQ